MQGLRWRRAARSSRAGRLRLQLQHQADIGVGDRHRAVVGPITGTGDFEVINACLQLDSRLIGFLDVQQVEQADSGFGRINLHGERIKGFFQIDQQVHVIFSEFYAGFPRDITGMAHFDFINASRQPYPCLIGLVDVQQFDQGGGRFGLDRQGMPGLSGRNGRGGDRHDQFVQFDLDGVNIPILNLAAAQNGASAGINQSR